MALRELTAGVLTRLTKQLMDSDKKNSMRYNTSTDSVLAELLLFSKAEYMVALAAYFDESGNHEGASIMVVAGYVATADQWKAFDHSWTLALRAANVKNGFHSTDFEKNRKDFAGWSQQKKMFLLRELVDIVRANTTLIICNGVRHDEFHRIKSEYGNVNISAYQFCSELCMHYLSSWARESVHRDPIEVFFEQGNKYMSDTMKLYIEATTKNYLSRQSRITKISAADKYQYTPLQAADLIAYETYRFWQDKGAREAPRFPLSALLSTKYRGGLHEDGTIRNHFGQILKIRSRLKTTKKALR